MTTAKALAVVIPARDEAIILRETLPALVLALELLPFPSRIFLIDDGSRDETAALAHAHGARVIVGEAKGPGAARNLGAREAMRWMEAMGADAEGWFLFLDADCRVAPDHFGRIARHLHDPEAALLSVQERPNLPRGLLRLGNRIKRAMQRWSATVWGIPVVHAGCLYVRARDFMRVGGFNHEHLFEDIELGFRFDPSRVRVLAEPEVVEVSDRRMHRVGALASLVVPARCSAVMFLSSQVAESGLASAFLTTFLKLGEDRLPSHLWWCDPERRLNASLGTAIVVTALWWAILFCLWTGALKRQPQRLLVALDGIPDRQAG
ncbi:Glycosyl transferase family 2 [compost metagenome]